MNFLANAVEELRIESAWLPPIVIARPFADSGPSPVASAVGSFLRPAITIRMVGGSEYRKAPYGEPGPSKWGYIPLALVAILAVMVALKGFHGGA